MQIELPNEIKEKLGIELGYTLSYEIQGEKIILEIVPEEAREFNLGTREQVSESQEELPKGKGKLPFTVETPLTIMEKSSKSKQKEARGKEKEAKRKEKPQKGKGKTTKPEEELDEITKKLAQIADEESKKTNI